MIRSVAASRYARALAEVVLAPESGLDANDVIKQLQGVEDLLRDSTDLRHVMFSPAVASSKKRAVLAQFAPGLGLAPVVRNFFYVVIDHRRMEQLAAIREAFELAVDETLGFVKAGVTSARSLSGPQRGSLEAELMKVTGKRVRMQFAVDESLIGGVVARIGSTIYDGSVRGQLDALRRRLTTES
jgi:F-type H+-transporting ATPase subunit delta